MAAGAADLLKRVPIFSDLDGKELERIATSMKQRTFSIIQATVLDPSIGQYLRQRELGIANRRCHERARASS